MLWNETSLFFFFFFSFACKALAAERKRVQYLHHSAYSPSQQPLKNTADVGRGRGHGPGKNHCINTKFSSNFTGYEYMHLLIRDCNDAGEICDLGLCGTKGQFCQHLEKDLDCRKIWASTMEAQAGPHTKSVPNWRNLPLGIQQRFQYGTGFGSNKSLGSIKVKIFDNRCSSQYCRSEHHYSSENMSSYIEASKSGNLTGTYGTSAANELRTTMRSLFSLMRSEGQKLVSALVVGSLHPWVEAILLSLNVSSVTVLEYNSIQHEDDRIKSYNSSEFQQAAYNGGFSGDNRFDVVVIYSSVEHSGLGRYGDAVNPYADLITMARVLCVTRPGGYLVLAVPMTSGDEGTVFNLHRIYGPVMLSNLLANWQQLQQPNFKGFSKYGIREGGKGFNQDVLILQRAVRPEKHIKDW